MKNKETVFNKDLSRSKEIEQAILGAILIEKNALSELPTLPEIDDFYYPQHQEVFKAVLSLSKKGIAVDTITMLSELKKAGIKELEGSNVGFFLSNLTSPVNSSANIEYHYYILKQLASKRNLYKFSLDLLNKSTDETSDALEVLNSALVDLQGISQNTLKASDKRVFDGNEVFSKTLNLIEENIKNRKEKGCVGVSSGLRELDNFIGGFRSGQLILIAARPSMGKTALAIKMLVSALKQDKKVLFFSLEMSKESVFNRVLAMLANDMIQDDNNRAYIKVREINILGLESGDISPEQLAYLKKANECINLNNLFVMDGTKVTNQEFNAISTAQYNKTGLDIIFSDYIELKKGDKSERKDLEIGTISKNSKQLAKKLNIPIIELSQLSRAVETREDKAPVLSDLKNSGELEQDADLVMMLYRPEYYGKKEFEDGTESRNKLGIFIRKQRSGRVPSNPIIVNYLLHSNQIFD